MAMTFSEMSELISTLESELATAMTEGNATRAGEIRLAIDDVTFLRAQSLVAEGNALAAQIAAARLSVEQVIARLQSRKRCARPTRLGA